MSEASRTPGPAHPLVRLLVRKNVLSGLLFIAIACLGLWLSREYPVGTLRRMGSGFMPQMLCWLLMGLGGIVLVQGLLVREATTEANDLPAAAIDAEMWVSGDGRIGEADLAALLGIAPGTLANRRLAGSAPRSYKLGGKGHRVTYALIDVAEWLIAHRCEP